MKILISFMIIIGSLFASTGGLLNPNTEIFDFTFTDENSSAEIYNHDNQVDKIILEVDKIKGFLPRSYKTDTCVANELDSNYECPLDIKECECPSGETLTANGTCEKTIYSDKIMKVPEVNVLTCSVSLGSNSYSCPAPYASSTHYVQCFSMRQMRWDGGCSHGTWCDNRPVACFAYEKDVAGSTSGLLRTDNIHSREAGGSLAVWFTAGQANRTNGKTVKKVNVRYSYFTFGRDVYIPGSLGCEDGFSEYGDSSKCRAIEASDLMGYGDRKCSKVNNKFYSSPYLCNDNNKCGYGKCEDGTLSTTAENIIPYERHPIEALTRSGDACTPTSCTQDIEYDDGLATKIDALSCLDSETLTTNKYENAPKIIKGEIVAYDATESKNYRWKQNYWKGSEGGRNYTVSYGNSYSYTTFVRHGSGDDEWYQTVNVSLSINNGQCVSNGPLSWVQGGCGQNGCGADYSCVGAASTYSCPNGGTLSGTTCTIDTRKLACEDGYEENASGTCDKWDYIDNQRCEDGYASGAVDGNMEECQKLVNEADNCQLGYTYNALTNTCEMPTPCPNNAELIDGKCFYTGDTSINAEGTTKWQVSALTGGIGIGTTKFTAFKFYWIDGVVYKVLRTHTNFINNRPTPPATDAYWLSDDNGLSGSKTGTFFASGVDSAIVNRTNVTGNSNWVGLGLPQSEACQVTPWRLAITNPYGKTVVRTYSKNSSGYWTKHHDGRSDWWYWRYERIEICPSGVFNTDIRNSGNLPNVVPDDGDYVYFSWNRTWRRSNFTSTELAQQGCPDGFVNNNNEGCSFVQNITSEDANCNSNTFGNVDDSKDKCAAVPIECPTGYSEFGSDSQCRKIYEGPEFSCVASPVENTCIKDGTIQPSGYCSREADSYTYYTYECKDEVNEFGQNWQLLNEKSDPGCVDDTFGDCINFELETSSCVRQTLGCSNPYSTCQDQGNGSGYQCSLEVCNSDRLPCFGQFCDIVANDKTTYCEISTCPTTNGIYEDNGKCKIQSCPDGSFEINGICIQE